MANLKETKFVKKITEKNLYSIYNFSTMKLFDEKFIIRKINQSQKGYFDFLYNDKVEIVSPKIRFVKDNKDKFESIFISQKELLDILRENYENYIKTLNINELNKNNILFACLNILIYLRNEEKFQDLEEIRKIMEKIFFVFLNL